MFTLSLRSRCEAALGTASIGTLNARFNGGWRKIQAERGCLPPLEPVASVNLI
jgi:hypothetical protein